MQSKSTLLALSLAVSSLASGQAVPWKAPAFRIVDSLRLDPKKEQPARDAQIALRSDGSIAVLGYGGSIVYLDSMGRRRWSRELGRDARWANVMNWRGDSLFVIDNAVQQAVAIGSNGGVGDAIEFPDFVRPTFRDRKKMTAYGAFQVTAVVDSTLVGTPRRPHRMGMYGPSTKTDPAVVPIVRANYDGIVQSLIASVRNEPKGDTWSILSDGRVVILRPTGDSLTLVAISPRADTIFTRKLPKTRVVFGSVGGPDGTIWVSASAGGKEFTHTAFDARGIPIGQVVLPAKYRLAAGDARHVWMLDTGGKERTAVRYTLRP